MQPDILKPLECLHAALAEAEKILPKMCAGEVIDAELRDWNKGRKRKKKLSELTAADIGLIVRLFSSAKAPRDERRPF